jgi:hypothetical protein
VIEALTEDVTVKPGDVVYVKVTREGNASGTIADGYSGELGIMQQNGILSST